MAFLGRMNCRGKYIDCEVFNGRCRKLQLNPKKPMFTMDNEGEKEILHTNSRTYIKTYDSERRELSSNSNTVRFVGDSASSCELNSMADTETSTLRCTSPRSLETVETLCLSREENSSDNSSISEGNRYFDGTTEDEGPQQQMILEECVEEKRQRERGSTTSMCSWEEEEAVSMYEDMQANEMETHSTCVPLLDLDSESPSIYYEQTVQLDQLKLIRQSNEAYENWLSGKKRQSQYKQQAARELREHQHQKDALRRQLNEQRVKEWCELKSRQTANTSNKRRAINCKVKPQLDEMALRRLQAWEMEKIQQAERRRTLQQREALRKQHEMVQRKQQASLAWQQWIKGVAQRPKPVPLNQGLSTLRGTVSDIYINPNQWVHVNENLGPK